MRIGVDLGGTKIEALALADDGSEVLRRRVPTPQGDYDGIVRVVAGLVRDLEGACGPARGIGIGTPGSLSPRTGRMRNANTTCLNGRYLDRDLEVAIGRRVALANDANCFALSEATDGAAAGAAVVFGVILGTGTGGGLVAHGRLLAGVNHVAGEWGHNPLPWPDAWERPGPLCYCGKRGCIETFLAGPGLAREYRLRCGENLEAAAIAQRADAGDDDARGLLELYAGRLAKALASVINVLDPDVIVLGGGVSNIDLLYGEVPRRWGAWVFSDDVRTALVRNRWGDSSGVRGAARLVP
jgi:fructokinase